MFDVLVGPEGRAGLAATLGGCDFALYKRPPESGARGKRNGFKSSTKNLPQGYMTPALFRIFTRPEPLLPGDAPVPRGTGTLGQGSEPAPGPMTDWARARTAGPCWSSALR